MPQTPLTPQQKAVRRSLRLELDRLWKEYVDSAKMTPQEFYEVIGKRFHLEQSPFRALSAVSDLHTRNLQKIIELAKAKDQKSTT